MFIDLVIYLRFGATSEILQGNLGVLLEVIIDSRGLRCLFGFSMIGSALVTETPSKVNSRGWDFCVQNA